MVNDTQEPKRPNHIDLVVGRNIRTRRAGLGLSQEKLADELGLTFQQIQKYEKGTNRVSASKLWAIASILNCSIEHLFKGAELATTANDTQDLLDGSAKSADELRLLHNYRKLNGKGKKAVHDTAALLAAAAENPNDPVLALTDIMQDTEAA